MLCLGANTAFQDAIDLADAFVKFGYTEEAKKEYESIMFPRGFKNAATSLNSTTMLHLTGWKSYVRNGMMKAIGFGMKMMNIM